MALEDLAPAGMSKVPSVLIRSRKLPASAIPRVRNERLEFEIVVAHPESIDRCTLYERKAILGPGDIVMFCSSHYKGAR